MMHKKVKKFIIFITVFVLAFSCTFNVFADAIPAPDWVTITTNNDGSKTLSVNTPVYLLDEISYYEYSTDSQLTWEKLNNNSGGEFVFDTTTEFALRYISNGFQSSIYTVTITVTKYSALTSSAGVTLLIPIDSELPSKISLSVHEIISGTDYTALSEYFGENRPFSLFNVFIIHNNNVYNNTTVNQWYFPVADMNVKYCKLYHMEGSSLTEIPASAEFNVLLCSTEKTGLFVIVEDKSFCKGDVDGDAAITPADARLALRQAVQLENLLPEQVTAADINSDNIVTPAEARTILRIAANLETI